jgi:Cu(I)/Ag(I) efflux system membrane protein CusA/SilA
MRAHDVLLSDVYSAVRQSNVDVGARSIEVNRVEYLVRGLGFIEQLADLENTVVAVNDNVPIYVKNVATVTMGPAPQRGALDKGGAETVGGVVVVRYGYNPLAAIKHVKQKIKQLEPGLPSKAVIDYSSVTRREVEAFAIEHGFEAYRGVELNQRDWKNWLKDAPADE